MVKNPGEVRRSGDALGSAVGKILDVSSLPTSSHTHIATMTT